MTQYNAADLRVIEWAEHSPFPFIPRPQVIESNDESVWRLFDSAWAELHNEEQ